MGIKYVGGNWNRIVISRLRHLGLSKEEERVREKVMFPRLEIRSEPTNVAEVNMDR